MSKTFPQYQQSLAMSILSTHLAILICEKSITPLFDTKHNYYHQNEHKEGYPLLSLDRAAWILMREDEPDEITYELGHSG